MSSAKRGEPGFCRKRKGGRKRRQRTFARPTATGGWGWCEQQCENNRPGRTPFLQEVQLETLTNPMCQEYGKSMKAVPRIELCAASVVKKSRPTLFRSTSSGFVKIEDDYSEESEETYYGIVLLPVILCLFSNMTRSQGFSRTFDFQAVRTVARGILAALCSPGWTTRQCWWASSAGARAARPSIRREFTAELPTTWTG